MKALVIGNGWVAQNRHIPVLRKIGVEVTVYDKRDAKSPPSGTDADFAVIAVPPHNRLEAVRTCLDLGIRRLFLEKPLATNLADADEIIALCQSSGATARNCHNFLFSVVGEKILSLGSFEDSIFIQQNRRDRKLPDWIDGKEITIGLDEFAHFGYLARAMHPAEGLNDQRCKLVFSEKAYNNRWEIHSDSQLGFVTANLWTDYVQVDKAVGQSPYWQYKQQVSRALSQLRQVLKVSTERALGRSNNFGTEKMWRAFLSDELSPKQDLLTELVMGRIILQDYLRTL